MKNRFTFRFFHVSRCLLWVSSKTCHLLSIYNKNYFEVLRYVACYDSIPCDHRLGGVTTRSSVINMLPIKDIKAFSH